MDKYTRVLRVRVLIPYKPRGGQSTLPGCAGGGSTARSGTMESGGSQLIRCCNEGLLVRVFCRLLYFREGITAS